MSDRFHENDRKKDVYRVLSEYYGHYDENGRLLSRHGSVEFLTTIRYIEKYLPSPESLPSSNEPRILEIGAGTGRYSHYFARLGYSVDAVELVEHNIELFRENTQPGERVSICQGDGTNLSMLPPDSYDIVLLLGPMYHLFTQEDKVAALSEATRVLKPGGVLFVSYCMNEPTVINFLFLKGNLFRYLESGLVDRETYQCYSTPEEVFVLYRQEEIDQLTTPLPLTRLHFVGTDMYTKYYQDFISAMDDDTFREYLRYHFTICERPDMTGMSHHTLDVLLKEKPIL